MSRKWIILLVAFGIVILGVGHYIENKGDVMGTRVVLEEVADSDLTSDEIFNAIEVVRKDFRKSFIDCSLTDLSYDLDRNDEDDRNALANQYQAQEAVVISGNIEANRTHEEFGVEKGNTYTGYQWLLTRNSSDGPWIIQAYDFVRE